MESTAEPIGKITKKDGRYFIPSEVQTTIESNRIITILKLLRLILVIANGSTGCR